MDSGTGIPREAGDIFEPFVSQKPGGTGLGLAIARKLAREHGGELTASQTPGPLGGACFELLLPPVP
jgi:signal transduction histidine kinase